jgi:hypothetical protein
MLAVAASPAWAQVQDAWRPGFDISPNPRVWSIDGPDGSAGTTRNMVGLYTVWLVGALVATLLAVLTGIGAWYLRHAPAAERPQAVPEDAQLQIELACAQPLPPQRTTPPARGEAPCWYPTAE